MTINIEKDKDDIRDSIFDILIKKHKEIGENSENQEKLYDAIFEHILGGIDKIIF